MKTKKPLVEDGSRVCPMALMFERLGGKWKCIILWLLLDGPRRFAELKKRMPGVAQKMLTQQLRDLERDGFVKRQVFAEVPPRVEYTATELALSLRSILHNMHAWADEHLVSSDRPSSQ